MLCTWIGRSYICYAPGLAGLIYVMHLDWQVLYMLCTWIGRSYICYAPGLAGLIYVMHLDWQGPSWCHVSQMNQTEGHGSSHYRSPETMPLTCTTRETQYYEQNKHTQTFHFHLLLEGGKLKFETCSQPHLPSLFTESDRRLKYLLQRTRDHPSLIFLKVRPQSNG